MAVFTYTALATDGRSTTGTIPAESRSQAIAAVIGKGLHPVSVEEQGSKKAAAATPVAPGTGRVTQKHVEAFTRELASLLAGGVPLARALALLKRETKAPGPQALWTQIHEDVIGGVALADSLARHPKIFSTVYIAMVRAGEAGGFLDVVLNQIAEFRTREQDLKGKVKAAMVYPCVLGCLAVGVLIFLLAFFIPTFSGIFHDMGGSLPVLTQVIIAASDLVTKYGLYVALVVVAAVVIIKRASSTDAGRRNIEKAILMTPALGKVVAFFAMVRFCRMLGTLLGAGVALVSSLKVAKEAIGNQTLSDTVALGIEEVQRGESLARALGQADRLFPASVVEMIAIAEETGRLDKELVRLSLAYESELDRQLRMLVSLAEPVLLFVMAGLIGTIVIGMLLPIFNLQQLMK
ncbi:MAG: type II secretion system F family protein [Phycisphaerae bacterium]